MTLMNPSRSVVNSRPQTLIFWRDFPAETVPSCQCQVLSLPVCLSLRCVFRSRLHKIAPENKKQNKKTDRQAKTRTADHCRMTAFFFARPPSLRPKVALECCGSDGAAKISCLLKSRSWRPPGRLPERRLVECAQPLIGKNRMCTRVFPAFLF